MWLFGLERLTSSPGVPGGTLRDASDRKRLEEKAFSQVRGRGHGGNGCGGGRGPFVLFTAPLRSVGRFFLHFVARRLAANAVVRRDPDASRSCEALRRGPQLRPTPRPH